MGRLRMRVCRWWPFVTRTSSLASNPPLTLLLLLLLLPLPPCNRRRHRTSTECVWEASAPLLDSATLSMERWLDIDGVDHRGAEEV
jgi:hypothetical protein